MTAMTAHDVDVETLVERVRRDEGQFREETTRSLARVGAQMELVLQTQGDHETRIRRVERWQTFLAGAASIIGTVGGYLLGHIFPGRRA